MFRRLQIQSLFSLQRYPYQTANLQCTNPPHAVLASTQTDNKTPKQQLQTQLQQHTQELFSAEGQHLFDSYTSTVNPIYEVIKTQIITIDLGMKQFSEAIHWPFQKSGKQIRPILLNMLSDSIDKGGDRDKITTWSALVETLHIASLVHDDVIDNSPLRRGRETVHNKFG